MRDLKYLLLIFITFHSIIFIGCSDNGNNPIVKNSGINGHVLYLDGSVGKFAQIQLRKLSSSLLLYTGADENGFYQFDSLQAGNYKVSFLSNNEDIYTILQAFKTVYFMGNLKDFYMADVQGIKRIIEGVKDDDIVKQGGITRKIALSNFVESLKKDLILLGVEE